MLPGGEGLEIVDAATGQNQRVWLDVAFRTEDTRGLAGAVAAKQAPALIGACLHCQVKGIKFYKPSP